MSLEQFLGGSLEDLVSNNNTPKSLQVEPQNIVPSGADSTIAPVTTPTKQDTTYSFPHSMGWFRSIQSFNYGEDINDKYITHIDGQAVK